MFYQNHSSLATERLKLENGVDFSFPLHLHSSFEFIVVTEGEMEDWMVQQIGIEGREHLYNVVLTGYRDEDIVYRLERLETLGNVVSIKDETLPWFDFERIYQDNRDNLLGLFIEKVKGLTMDEKRREQILSYGLLAMYYGRGDNGPCR